MTNRSSHYSPVAIVAHDAGGAEVISSYVVQQSLNCNFCLDGPALKIFKRKLGSINLMPLDVVIQQSDWMLCGTSWQSELEWEAIKLCKDSDKKAIAFLDHWSNYRERFIRGGEVYLPIEIWVGDVQAKLLAEEVLPEVIIRQVENPYFNDIKRELAAIAVNNRKNKNEFNILFVSEPVRDNGLRAFGNERHRGYTEVEALHYFLSNLNIFGLPIGCIVIRPHPSEPLNKYDWVKQKYQLPIINGGKRTLLQEIAESDVVVGFQSMAMVVGLLAGKRVISCIPPGGKKCGLPQLEIEHMQLLCSSIGEKNE